jgi:hypothetical protein
MKKNCEVCGIEIEICETALPLCDNCFNEKCECGHIRAKHVDNTGSCIHQYDWRHHYEHCKCEKFVLSKNQGKKNRKIFKKKTRKKSMDLGRVVLGLKSL